MEDHNALLLFPTAVLIGWFSGILINYLADVLPYKRRITRPFCSYCDTPFDLMDYVFWPRKCKSCGKYRRMRTWFVEIITIGICIYLWVSPPERIGILLSIIMLIYFGLVTIIDLEHRLIMHSVSLIGGVLCLAIGSWLHGFIATFLGGLAGFGIMLILYFLGLGFIKFLSKRRKSAIIEDEALGFGDVNLSGVIGLLLGWPGIVGALILGILLAGSVSLLYLLIMIATKKYRPNLTLPYGPFLIAATIGLILMKNITSN